MYKSTTPAAELAFEILTNKVLRPPLLEKEGKLKPLFLSTIPSLA